MKKQPCQCGHREGFDDPIDKEGDKETTRSLAHPPQRGEIHLHHHRNDHEPDKYRDGTIDMDALAKFPLL